METPYSDAEIERCTLRHRREVVFLLRDLIKRGEPVSIVFNEGHQSFLTLLLDLADRDDRLYFDISGSEETNRNFMKAKHASISAIVDGVRIQCSVGQARRGMHRGSPAFYVALPKSVLRLQRRELFRLQLPSAKPYLSRVRANTEKECELPLHDISVGGLGILSSKPLEFEQLEKLEDCRIDLRESGIIRVTLEVRYVLTLQGRTGKPLWHLGCKFVDLNPADETLIQRFMARIQAERRALAVAAE